LKEKRWTGGLKYPVYIYTYIFNFYNNDVIIFTVNLSYFLVQSLKDITKLEGHMPLALLLNINRTLKKEKTECLSHKK